MVVHVLAADGSRHPAYRIAAKGLAMRPELEAMFARERKWEKDTSFLQRAAH
jgi:hypothetical protein